LTYSDAHILVVAESEARGIVEDIRRQGFRTQAVDTGAEAIAVYRDYDLVMLDLALLDIDALAVCRAIREASDIPIIAFTNDGGAELDVVLCLQTGCDDCIVKPYNVRELTARIGAVLRRARPQPAFRKHQGSISYGPLSINPCSREVYVEDRAVKVTRKEFDLLFLLASRPNEVLSRSQLMTDIWDYPAVQQTSAQADRTIDTHVNSLRRKLGRNGWIVTVRGVGFRFAG
jgi:DNA-binding response OmpR family regulator